MASPSSKRIEDAEDDDDETLDELEGFDDFTIASSWERFISNIEAICRLWMVDGPQNLVVKGAENLSCSTNLYRVKSELKYGKKLYCLEYYFEVNNQGKKDSGWYEDLHNLQLLFGVKEFMVIAPLSVSGVILDAPEASKLLSSVAVALSNCGSAWPAFVPVHDSSRKAFIGIQNMGMTSTRRFETDLVGSQVPIRLMHLEGLYELFVSKFALHVIDISTQNFDVHFTMKLTYRTPPFDDEEDDIREDTETPGEESNSFSHVRTQWDDDCPWSEWYSAEDPIKGFELIATWSDVMVGSSSRMAETENASSFDADNWILFPVLLPNPNDDSFRSPVGFASQLRNLVDALDICYDSKFIEDYVSAGNPGPDNSKSPIVLPPMTVLDRVLKEIFNEGVQNSNHPKREHSNSRRIKGAPLDSLFAQFCLHALWFGTCNIRAIALLWIEFVREVRWYWEESEALPGVLTDSGIDLSACLVHQKLQMLAICIDKRGSKDDLSHYPESKDHTHTHKMESHGQQGRPESPSQDERLQENQASSIGSLSASRESAIQSSMDVENTVPADPQSTSTERRGSCGIVKSMMLLHSPQPMHAPYTQDAPVMTEDMHEERLHAVEAFADSFSSAALLERDVLSSDMSAFKAANPGAVFEDFIRWHSPGDWESDKVLTVDGPKTSEVETSTSSNWPPRGRLSKRMSEGGNSWRQIWNDSQPLPASMQKSLLDPIREGEKILHYLETLKPQQLLAQMVCTAFKATLDTLNQTSFGNLKHMKTKIGQFYLTIAFGLKPLKGDCLPDKAELIGDLRCLCTLFGHIEGLIIFAASIHRKLLDVPRLSEAIFNDYFNFYLPNLGTGLASICFDKEFTSKQHVKAKERDHIARMFPPPTANQSWRKVLSMGNLLNGHEPILREIIFYVCDKMDRGRYESNVPMESLEETKTRRMYICGTSNDLQVALSATSWD